MTRPTHMPKMKKPTQMNRRVALDPAYPPLAGDPLMAAPLLTTTTLLPGGSGFSSASRSQVNARAIPRPRPRLAPTTTVVLPDKSLIIVLFLCMSMVSLAVVLVVAAPPEAGLVATEWRAVGDRQS